MDPITPESALAFAREWIDAWNAHDLDRILSHYADDVSMGSPFMARIDGNPDGTLRGKTAVGAYWRRALGAFPDLRFELLGVHAGAGSLCIRYRSVLGLEAVEWMRFGPDGKVAEAAAHYDRAP